MARRRTSEKHVLHTLGRSFLTVAALMGFAFFVARGAKVISQGPAFFSSSPAAAKIGRFPAQTPTPFPSQAPECYIDTFTIDKIKAEIADMESKWKAGSYSLPARFAFLKKAKPPEIEYLARFGGYVTLGTGSGNCKSLPCILNSAYSALDGEEGYRIYHFFLRMGYPLSTIRDNPGTRDGGKQGPLIDYLFKNSELNMFNLVTELLTAGYRDMPNLRSIHRVRDGYSPGPFVAGWYQSGTSTPHILLTNPTDPNVSRNKYIYDDWAFAVVTHELSHAFDDFVGGSRLKTAYYYSQLNEWKEKNWKKYELKKHGKIIAVDMPEPSSKEFVTDYAKKSTKEDFADTAAYTFYNPAELRKNAPNKGRLYVYMSEYGRELHWDEWKEWARSGIQQQMLGRIADVGSVCMTPGRTPAPEEKGDQLLGPNYEFFNAPMRACFQAELQKHFMGIVQNLNRQEYWSCNYMKTRAKHEEIEKKVYGELAGPIRTMAESSEDFKHLIAEYKKAKAALDHCDSDEAFVKHWSVKGGDVLHQTEMETCVDQQLSGFPDVIREFPEIRTNALADRSYVKSAERVRARIGEVGKALPGALQAAASVLWKSCFEAAPSFSTASRTGLVLTPYDGGSSYLTSEMLSCLNASVDSVYDQQAEAAFSGTAVNLSNILMKELVRSIYSAHLLEALKGIQTERNKIEAAMNFSAIVEAYAKKLAADPAYLKKLSELPGEFLPSCQLEVTPGLDAELTKALTAKKERWVTTSVETWRQSVLPGICSRAGQALGSLVAEEKAKLESLLKEAQGVLKARFESIRTYVPIAATQESFTVSCLNELTPMTEAEVKARVAGKTFRFFSAVTHSKEVTSEFCADYWRRYESEKTRLSGQTDPFADRMTQILRRDLKFQEDIYSKDQHREACLAYFDARSLSVVSSAEFQSLAKQDWVRKEDLQPQVRKATCERMQKAWIDVELEAAVLSTADPLAQKIAAQARPRYEEIRRQKLSGCIATFPRSELAFTRFQRKKCAVDSVFQEKVFSDVEESWEFQHEDAHPKFRAMVGAAVTKWVAEDKLQAEALIADLDAQGGGLIKK